MNKEKVYLLRLYGTGTGTGTGNGAGNGNGTGDGDGYGDGNGTGDGNGYGTGNGYGDGNGAGYGAGYGYGNGAGYGAGYGFYYALLHDEWFEVSGEIENSLCMNIPAHLLDKVDADFIKKVNNLECLRSLRDKIGLKKYLDILGAKVIHAEKDHQGKEMKLYKCNENGEISVLLEVICPSTGRMYHLYPPNQKAKTCSEAKTSTFNNKAIAYRHGDVALFKIDGDKITIPFSET